MALPAPVGSRPKEEFILAAGRFWDEAKNVAVLAQVAKTVRWPICVAGPVRGFDGTHPLPPDRVVAGHSWANYRGRRCASTWRAPGFSFHRRDTNRSGLPSSKRQAPIVRSCSRTFRACANCWDGAALFVDPRDAGDVAGALDRVCQDATLRRKLAEAASRRARRYSVRRPPAPHSNFTKRSWHLAPALCRTARRWCWYMSSFCFITRSPHAGITATPISCAASRGSFCAAATRSWSTSQSTAGA